MNTFFRYLVTSAIVWLCLVAGYLSRDVLGDWLVSVHTTSYSEQVWLLVAGTFRLLTTFVVLSVSTILFCALAFMFVALGQEVWYQFVKRHLVSLWLRQQKRRIDAIQEVLEEDEEEAGAPKKSVNARRHARNPASAQRAEELAELGKLGRMNEERKLPELEVVVDGKPK